MLQQKNNDGKLIIITITILILFLLSFIGFFYASEPPLEGMTINYARKHLLFIIAAGSSITTALMLIGLFVLSLLTKQKRAAFLGFLVVAVVCFTAFTTNFFESYSEVGNLALDNHTYRLIQFLHATGFYKYAICECDPNRETCTCYHIHSGSIPTSTTSLSAKKSTPNTIVIGITEKDKQTVCSYKVPLNFSPDDEEGYFGYYSECRK